MTEPHGDTWTPTVALVLAAGSSRRLGRPKQLLPYLGGTLLGVTLDVVRGHGFDRIVVTVGGSADQVRASVDLSDTVVVESVQHSQGCSSSIVGALDRFPRAARGFHLFLGDQPHIPVAAVDRLRTAAARGAQIAVVRYRDGLGHPFWFSREVFADLAALRGDKAVWKLVESGKWPVVEVETDASIPLDVDTEDDYRRLLASASHHRATLGGTR